MQKFVVEDKDTVPCMPASWKSALREVDLSEEVPIQEAAWKYWVPNAGLVLGSQGLERQKRYASQWLKIRDAWYYLLRRHDEGQDQLQALRGPQWHDFLNVRDSTGDGQSHEASHTAAQAVAVPAPSQNVSKDGGDVASAPEPAPQAKAGRSKKRNRNQERRHANTAVREILARCQLNLSTSAKWFGREIASLDSEEWRLTARQIGWELSEVGFRVELGELDRYLVPRQSADSAVDDDERRELLSRVFPSGRDLIPKAIPTTGEGLAAKNNAHRAVYLEALRQVVCRWPDVSDGLKFCAPFTAIASPVLFQEKEKEVAAFYCRSFFRASGRAPTLFCLVEN